ncbi:MAG TPA: TIGR01777 family oxidoreductase [Pyrinomonadaceae bacterium]|nr:TIGR01777 family oxidoreductase [Pyrinomonadaceae bacterium]
MRIVVSGATGLVGSSLVPSLVADGHEVTRLVRRSSEGAGGGVRDVLWNPAEGRLDAGEVEGHDAFVHLAGENVAERWTPEKKRRIKESRTKGTRLMAETIASLKERPRAFVSASAVGFYGADRGETLLDEASGPGSDFLADVCREWEAACGPARAAGVRTANLRIGVVLSEEGGALAKMLPPFRLGAGGRIGGGRQWMSWIALDDVLGIIRRALTDEALAGPVNTVAPRPARNEEFTKTLGRVLNRPTVFPVPAFAVKLMFGEMGEALLLGSARVEPARLRAAGYEFQYPELEGALRRALGE